MRRVLSTTTRSAFYLSLACCMAGCGGSDVDTGKNPRSYTSGNVEIDGQPVASGTVSFMHVDTGYVAICNIYDGEYESESGKGPNPGENLVLVTGRETADGDPMWQQPWSKKVQVSDSDFTADFAITSAEMTPFDPSTIEIDN